jgi:hypothetical protein
VWWTSRDVAASLGHLILPNRRVSLLTHSAVVSLGIGASTDPGALAEAAEVVGFDAKVLSVAAEAPPASEKLEVRLRIDGMTCASCVASVTNGLTALDGVESAQ